MASASQILMYLRELLEDLVKNGGFDSVCLKGSPRF